MKHQLRQIFDALGEISTKGHDTFIMADVRRLLGSIVDSLPDEKPASNENPVEGEED